MTEYKYLPQSREEKYHDVIYTLTEKNYSRNDETKYPLLKEVYNPNGLKREDEYVNLYIGKNNLADAIFGQQIKHRRLSMKNLEDILKKRAELHYSHKYEIQVQISKNKNRISMLRRPYAGFPERDSQGLERMLSQLEQESRREDIAFWKDTAEIRKEFLETAMEYLTTKHRADILSSLGAEDE